MKKNIRMLFLVAGCTALGAHAADIRFLGNAENGRRLYDEKCMGCHIAKNISPKLGSAMAQNPLIKGHADLLKQVLFCNHLTKTGFTAEESEDVSTYLSAKVYDLDAQVKQLQQRIEELEAQKKAGGAAGQ